MQRRQRRRGFTLVEVMVVLAVTAMLSSLILVYNASTRETLRLFSEKIRIAQLILRSKSLALSTYADGEAPCGYGVHFDRTAGSYTLVAYRPADCDDLAQVDTNPAVFEPVQMSSFQLPPSVSYVTPTNPTASDVSYVLFVPPDPLVLVAREDGSLVQSGLGQVELESTSGASAIVTVNAAGQVTF